jgi:NADH-quinone oxidoreductase subunit M
MGKVLLPLMIFLPLAGALAVLLLGSARWPLVRLVSLATTLVTLALVAVVTFDYDPNRAGPRTAQQPFKPDPASEVVSAWFSFESPGTTAVRSPESTATGPRIEMHLGLDGLSIWLVGLTALLMVSAVLVSWEAITDRPAEYYALLLALETGMIGVFCAMDLVLFYVFFEFTLLPLFFLIGLWGGPQKRYAARKFFLYTLAGSLISLVGLVALVLTIHYQTGTLTFSIPMLAQLTAGGAIGLTTQKWIFLALFAGFAVKVPLFPLHTWLPLAHVEAPTAGSVLLAGVLLKLGTYGFLRLALPLVPDACVTLGVPLVGILAVIGILYGALCSLAQDDIKKLIAYSSVSHLGFCMLGLFALNAKGLSGGLLQMVNHGLSTGLLFLLVGMLYERYHTRQLKDMGGLAARLPLLAIFMVVSCLSSVGLPGLNGFIGEVLCLMGMYEARPAYALVGALGIILGAWYLLAMLQRAFFGPLHEPHHGEGEVRDLSAREVAALAPLVFFCVWIGVYPKPFLDAMRPEVDALAARLQATAAARP